MYASKEKFDGQRASVGRVVVINTGSPRGVQAGLIQAIDANGKPEIAVWDTTGQGGAGSNFVATKTEEDVNNLPPCSWTWPVRV